MIILSVATLSLSKCKSKISKLFLEIYEDEILKQVQNNKDFIFQLQKHFQQSVDLPVNH